MASTIAVRVVTGTEVDNLKTLQEIVVALEGRAAQAKQ